MRPDGPRRSPAAPGRLACVDLPAFPLQLLRRAHPEWAGAPAVVVADDTPQAPCTVVNEVAWAAGVRPGQRYAAALALAPGLRAGVVRPEQLAAGVAEATRRLRRFSPVVEPCAEEPGVFWLDAGGLTRLCPSLQRWAQLVRRGLARAGIEASVAVGHTRFGAYALARHHPGVQVVRDAAAEYEAARRVPLARLAIDPEARDTLARLGVRLVGGLLHLPAEGLRRRFGDGVARLHRLARDAFAGGGVEAPLRPDVPPEPLTARVEFEWPEGSLLRLLREWRRALEPLLARVAARGGAVAAVRVACRFDRAAARELVVRPATATLDATTLLHLLELTIERAPFVDGCTECLLTVEAAAATAEQLRLFVERAGRDRRAADRALAMLSATYGEAAVVRAELRDGHLPEAAFAFVPCERVVAADPFDSHSVAGATGSLAQGRPAGALVRRVLARPEPFDSHPVAGAPGLLAQGEAPGAWRLLGGPVTRWDGPYVVAGGWWATPVHRVYHFAAMPDGQVAWVYFDAERGRWYLQGWVE